MSATQKKRIIEGLLASDIVKRGDFTLKSGQKSYYYFNFRNLISHPKLFNKLIEYIGDFIPRKTFDVDRVCGVPLSGIPIATGFFSQFNIPMIIKRPVKKDYGLQNIIDGSYKTGDRVCLIEDVVTTGNSALEIIDELTAEKLNVTKLIILLERSSQENINNPIDNIKSKYPNIDVTVIFQESDFEETLEQKMADTPAYFTHYCNGVFTFLGYNEDEDARIFINMHQNIDFRIDTDTPVYMKNADYYEIINSSGDVIRGGISPLHF